MEGKKRTRQKTWEKIEIRADDNKKNPLLLSLNQTDQLFSNELQLWWLLISSDYISQLLLLWSTLIGTWILVVWVIYKLHRELICITGRKITISDNKIFASLICGKILLPELKQLIMPMQEFCLYETLTHSSIIPLLSNI